MQRKTVMASNSSKLLRLLPPFEHPLLCLRSLALHEKTIESKLPEIAETNLGSADENESREQFHLEGLRHIEPWRRGGLNE